MFSLPPKYSLGIMSDKTKRMPNGLASPFLYEELFASERSGEAPPFSSSLIDESPVSPI